MVPCLSIALYCLSGITNVNPLVGLGSARTMIKEHV